MSKLAPVGADVPKEAAITFSVTAFISVPVALTVYSPISVLASLAAFFSARLSAAFSSSAFFSLRLSAAFLSPSKLKFLSPAQKHRIKISSS